MKIGRFTPAFLILSVFIFTSTGCVSAFYKHDLNSLARKAQARIETIDKEMAKQEEAQKAVEE